MRFEGRIPGRERARGADLRGDPDHGHFTKVSRRTSTEKINRHTQLKKNTYTHRLCGNPALCVSRLSTISTRSGPFIQHKDVTIKRNKESWLREPWRNLRTRVFPCTGPVSPHENPESPIKGLEAGYLMPRSRRIVPLPPKLLL